jgi:signal peptidase I
MLNKSIFPQINKWNQDNFGPIYIPQKDKTVDLNTASLPFYIITDYEKMIREIKWSIDWIK